ncbi:hypothetical protein CJO92_21435 (plasmid) [Ralstonia solanacearum]|nr:hypothetical protein CJO92_21435 [Ralstonia solanacearum]
MKATRLTAIAATVLIAGVTLYGLLSLFGLTSIRHESDIIKRGQIPLYVTKADAGDYDAASALYLYYKNDDQPEYALHWLRMAANGGSESPNEWLIDALTKSSSKKHQEEAMVLLRKLADEGKAPFQVRFGEELMRGVHVSSDTQLAKRYFLSAAKQGYKPAIVKYTESMVGSLDATEDRLSAMTWIRVARLCLGDDDREKMDSVERSVMASDPSASLKTGENDVNKNADYIYASIIDRTRKNKGLDFRYCGIDR